MTKETKVTLITGFTFITIFFALMIAEVFITRATAYALFTSLFVYLFFDMYFFEQKKTEC
ncbi:hypothetical protein HMPREF2799_06205 [Staphylococcus sp. HMSC057A02]|nr:hypothetical protein HMPREF2799_06205 [Staphylococcus sp. HMSC057A02]